jgi:hypothetical protein
MGAGTFLRGAALLDRNPLLFSLAGQLPFVATSFGLYRG